MVHGTTIAHWPHGTVQLSPLSRDGKKPSDVAVDDIKAMFDKVAGKAKKARNLI